MIDAGEGPPKVIDGQTGKVDSSDTGPKDVGSQGNTRQAAQRIVASMKPAQQQEALIRTTQMLTQERRAAAIAAGADDRQYNPPQSRPPPKPPSSGIARWPIIGWFFR